MADMPTWDGEPVQGERIIEVTRQAFDVLERFMTGGGLNGYSKEELIHITEAASLVRAMTDYAHSSALPLARVRGASLAELSAATGLPRSTLQTKQYTNLYAQWEGFGQGR